MITVIVTTVYKQFSCQCISLSTSFKTFRFQDEDSYKQVIFSILQLLAVLRGEPASFWQENMIVVIILLRVLTRMSW